jgi:uncharacterized protein YegP (UPF0339 family)
MIKLRKAVNGEFYVIVTAANGEELFKTSETYKRRDGALNAVLALAKALKAPEMQHVHDESE